MGKHFQARWRAWLPLLCAVLGLGGCFSSGGSLNTKRDYSASIDAYSTLQYSTAVEQLPTKEGEAFIPTMERAYLDWIRGSPDIESLKRYRELVNDRFRFVVSREVKSLFYAELPEGYYASEHEIVWLHLLLGWAYSDMGMPNEACVEARMAGFLLDAPWSEEGRFDDATLRVILGSLFARCGEWSDAVVDFRRANELDPALAWAAELSEMPQPPADLFVILGGAGTEPQWDPALEWNSVRAARGIDFQFTGQRSPLTLETQATPIALHLTGSTRSWYLRHVERDNAIQELIQDSKYGLNTAYESGRHASVVAAGTVVVVISTAAGLGISYLLIRLCAVPASGCDPRVIVAIIYAPIGGFQYGKKKSDELTEASLERLRFETDPSNFYRFVRFLPEYVWVGWSNQPLGDGELVLRKEGGIGTLRFRPTPVRSPSGNRVTVAHNPDLPTSRSIEEERPPGNDAATSR